MATGTVIESDRLKSEKWQWLRLNEIFAIKHCLLIVSSWTRSLSNGIRTDHVLAVGTGAIDMKQGHDGEFVGATTLDDANSTPEAYDLMVKQIWRIWCMRVGYDACYTFGRL